MDVCCELDTFPFSVANFCQWFFEVMIADILHYWNNHKYSVELFLCVWSLSFFKVKVEFGNVFLQNKLVSVCGRNKQLEHSWIMVKFPPFLPMAIYIRKAFCFDFSWFIHVLAFFKACLNFTISASSLGQHPPKCWTQSWAWSLIGKF